MIPAQTATGTSAEERAPPEVSDLAAETHAKALAVVRHLLKAEGVHHTYAVHTVALKPGVDDKPWPGGQPTRRAPELVAYSREGWEVAVVTVGERSGCSVVSPPAVGVASQVVNAGQPHAVVDLILAALPRETA